MLSCRACDCTYGPYSFGRRPSFTVAWGNAPGMVCVLRIVWPKAIFTPGVSLSPSPARVIMAFGQNGVAGGTTSWGVAPGYGDKWPSANILVSLSRGLPNASTPNMHASCKAVAHVSGSSGWCASRTLPPCVASNGHDGAAGRLKCPCTGRRRSRRIATTAAYGRAGLRRSFSAIERGAAILNASAAGVDTI